MRFLWDSCLRITLRDSHCASGQTAACALCQAWWRSLPPQDVVVFTVWYHTYISPHTLKVLLTVYHFSFSFFSVSPLGVADQTWGLVHARQTSVMATMLFFFLFNFYSCFGVDQADCPQIHVPPVSLSLELRSQVCVSMYRLSPRLFTHAKYTLYYRAAPQILVHILLPTCLKLIWACSYNISTELLRHLEMIKSLVI